MPELRTDRLILRPPTMADAERMGAVANDKRIARNLTSVFPHPYSVADAEEFLALGIGFVIEVTEPVGSLSPGLIGMVDAIGGEGENHDLYMFGYWLAVEAWGHGYATEAGRACLDHLLATSKPRRVEAAVYEWNPASGRVLENLGFELEGRFSDRVCRFGEVTDELMYRLVM